MVIGRSALERLAQCRVAVFGLGGVGGAVVEALARSGIGAIDLIDKDHFEVTNLNRQMLCTHQTLGMLKTEAARQRIELIHPSCKVTSFPLFYLPETADQIDLSVYDYVIDAIDTVTAKLYLIEACSERGIPIISAMGAGNRLSPEGFVVTDIYQTKGDKLARVMRRELRKRGISKLKVVATPNEPVTPILYHEDGTPYRPDAPGSTPFAPPVCGYTLAAAAVSDLIG